MQMDKDTAWRVIQVGFKCGRDLQELLQLLKARSDASEYKQFATGIATVVDTINVQLIDRALKNHPELKKKIESDLAKAGRVA
jgi:hypothetical protein